MSTTYEPLPKGNTCFEAEKELLILTLYYEMFCSISWSSRCWWFVICPDALFPLFKNKWQIRLSEKKNLERNKNPLSVVVANEGKGIGDEFGERGKGKSERIFGTQVRRCPAWSGGRWLAWLMFQKVHGSSSVWRNWRQGGKRDQFTSLGCYFSGLN